MLSATIYHSEDSTNIAGLQCTVQSREGPILLCARRARLTDNAGRSRTPLRLSSPPVAHPSQHRKSQILERAC